MLELWDKVVFYMERGGIVMPPLVAAACVLWYGLGYRLLTLRRGNIRSVRILIDRYQQGNSEPPRGVIDSGILRGLQVVQHGSSHLRRKLDEALDPYHERLARFRSSSRTIVVIAPLLGLLGTVIGMVETFESLGDMSLFAQSGGVAGGISQALFSTQLGLAVAVPGLIVGHILNRRQELLEMELCKVKDILCTEARYQAEARA